jgi:hypothetical protein
MMLRVAAIWSGLRILLQVGDVTLGPMFKLSMAQFADYLFNPMSPLPTSYGNPPGIPPVPLDLILLCDIGVLLAVARASMKK